MLLSAKLSEEEEEGEPCEHRRGQESPMGESCHLGLLPCRWRSKRDTAHPRGLQQREVKEKVKKHPGEVRRGRSVLR